MSKARLIHLSHQEGANLDLNQWHFSARIDINANEALANIQREVEIVCSAKEKLLFIPVPGEDGVYESYSYQGENLISELPTRTIEDSKVVYYKIAVTDILDALRKGKSILLTYATNLAGSIYFINLQGRSGVTPDKSNAVICILDNPT